MTAAGVPARGVNEPLCPRGGLGTMRKMRSLIALAALAGCATAGQDNPAADASPTPDAPIPIDAQVVDALIMRTLSQTSDMTVADNATIACGAAGTTRENSWYRVFPLTTFGIAGAFNVTQVAFAVESAGPTAQMVEIRLGTYAGTPGTLLNTAMIGELETATVQVPASTTAQLLTAPLSTTVPAGSRDRHRAPRPRRPAQQPAVLRRLDRGHRDRPRLPAQRDLRRAPAPLDQAPRRDGRRGHHRGRRLLLR